MLRLTIFFVISLAFIATAFTQIAPRDEVRQNDCRAQKPPPNGCLPDPKGRPCLYPKGTPSDDTCPPDIVEEKNSAFNYSCQRTSIFKEGVDWLSKYPHNEVAPPRLTTSKPACWDAISDLCWNMTKGPIYEQWAVVSDVNYMNNLQPPDPSPCTLGYFLPRKSGHGSYLKCYWKVMNMLNLNCIDANYLYGPAEDSDAPQRPLSRDHGTINVKEQEYPWLVDPLEPAFFISSKGEADITLGAPDIPKEMFADGTLWVGYPPKERAHV